MASLVDEGQGEAGLRLNASLAPLPPCTQSTSCIGSQRPNLASTCKRCRFLSGGKLSTLRCASGNRQTLKEGHISAISGPFCWVPSRCGGAKKASWTRIPRSTGQCGRACFPDHVRGCTGTLDGALRACGMLNVLPPFQNSNRNGGALARAV